MRTSLFFSIMKLTTRSVKVFISLTNLWSLTRNRYMYIIYLRCFNLFHIYIYKINLYMVIPQTYLPNCPKKYSILLYIFNKKYIIYLYINVMTVTPLPASFLKTGQLPNIFGQFPQKKRRRRRSTPVYREFGILPNNCPIIGQ